MPVFTVSPMRQVPSAREVPRKSGSTARNCRQGAATGRDANRPGAGEPIAAANNSPPFKVSPTLALPRFVSLATLKIPCDIVVPPL